jgi:hypothetical protein
MVIKSSKTNVPPPVEEGYPSGRAYLPVSHHMTKEHVSGQFLLLLIGNPLPGIDHVIVPVVVFA